MSRTKLGLLTLRHGETTGWLSKHTIASITIVQLHKNNTIRGTRWVEKDTKDLPGSTKPKSRNFSNLNSNNFSISIFPLSNSNSTTFRPGLSLNSSVVRFNGYDEHESGSTAVVWCVLARVKTDPRRYSVEIDTRRCSPLVVALNRAAGLKRLRTAAHVSWAHGTCFSNPYVEPKSQLMRSPSCQLVKRFALFARSRERW